MDDVNSTNDIAWDLDIVLPELPIINRFLTKLEDETDSDMVDAFITKLVKTFKLLVDSRFDVLKTVALEKRITFFDELRRRCHAQTQRMTDVDWTDLNQQLKILEGVCYMDFNQKPLSFAREALDYLNLISDCERNVLKMIENMRRESGMENILNQQYECLKKRRKKIVLACVGTMKASKSSFINYLLEAKICPVGTERTTGLLTQIVYGDRIMVKLVSPNGEVKKEFAVDDEAAIESTARHLIKLEGADRKSELCKDIVIIELNRYELQEIEIWDIPGYDENPNINTVIEDIIGDADLVFALTSLIDDMRESFVTLVNTILSKKRKVRTTVGATATTTVSVDQPRHVCFIATKIDLVSKNPMANGTVDEALQELYEHIREEFPNVVDKTKDRFIPSCTHPSYGLFDFLRCHREFIEKSVTFFRSGVQDMITMRIQYLLEIVLEVFDYADIDRAIVRHKQLEDEIKQAVAQFGETLKNDLQTPFEEIRKATLFSADMIIQKKTIWHSKEFEEQLQKIIMDKYESELKDKKSSIHSCLTTSIDTFLTTLNVNPGLSEKIEQSIRNNCVKNPYDIPIGQYSSVPWYYTETEIVHSSPNKWTNSNKYIFGFFHQLKKATFNLFSHVGGYRARVTPAVEENIENIMKTLIEQVKEDISNVINDQFGSVLHKIGEKTIKLVDAKKTHQAICATKYLAKETNFENVVRIFLDIHDAQSRIDKTIYTVDTNTQLGVSNCSVFAAHLHTDDGRVTRPIAAKRVPIDKFSINEIRYVQVLNHPNLVKFVGVRKCTTPEGYYDILMERLDTDLCKYLSHKSKKGQLQDESLDHMIMQITTALDYMHSEDLIHRDIKPTNIFVKIVEDQQPIICIGDFGFIHQFPISAQGTQGYTAPELRIESISKNIQPITTKADVYSLGVTIEEMITYPHCGNADNIMMFWSKMADQSKANNPGERPSCSSILRDRKDI